MAKKVTAQVTGGQTKTFDDVNSVDDVRLQLGISAEYTANVNGDPAEMSENVEDYAFVTFAEKVKGN